MESVSTTDAVFHVRATGANIELELGAETIQLSLEDARDLVRQLRQKITRAEYVAGQISTIRGWIGAPR